MHEMKLLNRKNNDKLEITREEWDVMREFRKTPFKERFMNMEALLNAQ